MVELRRIRSLEDDDGSLLDVRDGPDNFFAVGSDKLFLFLDKLLWLSLPFLESGVP